MPVPAPERRYSVVIELYDHTSTTFEPSPLYPNTRTRLPPALDHDLLASHRKLVLPSGSLWRHFPISRKLQTTSSAPIASPPLGPPRRPPTSATASSGVWSESTGPVAPPLIATADLFTPSQATQKASLDFRFGPISIDCVDHPTPMSYAPLASSSSPNNPSMSPPLPVIENLALSPAGGNSLHLSIPGSPLVRTRSSRSSGDPKSPTTSTGTPSIRPPEKSGTTDLYWGTIHLYREGGVTGESSEKEKRKAVQDDAGTVVGLVSVPGIITAAALLTFISPALDSVLHLRVLRDSTPNRTLVLIRFRDASDASEFRTMYNGRPYHDTKDSELCHVVPISSIQLKTSTTPPFTFPYPSSNLDGDTNDQVELPTCPICLERLDANVSGLISQLCSHDAHCECLLKWGDSRCPICRQTNLRNRRGTNTAPPPSLCTVCQSPANLWICVICGNVGCGRYQGGHAHSHFEESGHRYSLEIETGRVWSYADDEYVHRLIRSRTDGKLVELPSMFGNNGRSTEANLEHKQRARSNSTSGGGGGGTGGPDRSTEASQDKLEAMGVEYANLMTSQLESQRGYYEEEMARDKDEIAQLRKKREGLEREREGWVGERNELVKRVKDIEAREEETSRAWKAKFEAMQKQVGEDESRRKKEKVEWTKMRKQLEKELESEKAVTKSLTENLGHLRSEVAKREAETVQVRAEVDDLREQMRDVMFALSARDQIEAQGGAAEAAGGTIIAPTLAPSTPSSTQRRKKK
ncbi:BQ5605_C021g09401 [Microbotryum silenes-dioicae]|uniref:BQ5605_C021g09401 protein n=1 Tax=Microbotryum silenes-dioicae TaxID=796604 RepID=A0A2X0PEC5_9BASI|nr:BQ5605_C021g09401 [Microbotryum silenes-dioicae]